MIPESDPPAKVLMVGPFPPAVGGLANNMNILWHSSLARRFRLLRFSTAKRRRHVFPNRPHWDSVPYLILHEIAFLFSLLKNRPQVVYLKATSDTGFLRDALLMGTARLFGRPVLCHLHGRPMGRLFTGGSFASRFTRRAMGLAEATIVLSPGLARQFAGLFPAQRLVPVPNVVDLERFEPGAPGPGFPRILTVGRLSREKGTWDLLEVARRVLDRGATVEFRLAGIGESAAEEEALKAEARRLGIEDSVTFLGTVRGAALAAEYAAASIFFLPTYAEIFPNVVLEALASGLPVVTTDVPVIPEMFTEAREGYRHSPGDLEGMAASLLRLAGDDALRGSLGAAARTLAEERYGVERGAARIGDLLEELAG